MRNSYEVREREENETWLRLRRVRQKIFDPSRQFEDWRKYFSPVGNFKSLKAF